VIKSFDRIAISVPDLRVACDDYAALFGVRPVPLGQVGHAWLGLANTVLELIEKPVAAAASHPQASLTNIAVDHLVLRAVDADRCIALFNGELGIRLALDQDVPEWGGRMLFFRAGKLTLEVIANQAADSAEANTFWGMTFQVPDIDAMAAKLAAAGVELSAVRKGRKPGTRVATVHSHCLGLPTLLLQPAVP
jgi:catechol 2,3-dioxygenase-like lactoylglutathione lyase family enzyme